MFDAHPSDKISVFSVLQSVIPPTVLPTIVPSCGNKMSAGLANVHTWLRYTAKNWMQYSAGHVATTALLLTQMA